MADAVNMKPRFIPDDKLLPRDDSGGRDFRDKRTAEWGDGGRVTGSKSHLGPGGKEGRRERDDEDEDGED